MKNRSILNRTLSYLAPFKWKLAIAGLYLTFSTIIGFLQPLVIQKITDEGMLGNNFSVLVGSVLILAILVILGQIVEMAQTRLFVTIHIKSYYTIFQQAFKKLLRLKKSYFEDKNNAEVLNSIQMDVSQVASVTDRYTVMSFFYIFRIISGLAGLLIIRWKLTFIVLVMVP